MIIDFHTHTFPDRIAKASIESLSKCSGITPHTDGTGEGLRRSMEEGGVDLSVVLPVVTKPSQFETVNKVAAKICEAGEGLLSFGGIHPECSDIRQKVREIKNLGLKGIKIHPAYQEVCADDIRYLRILDAATEQGLIITMHAGVDIGLPNPVYASVDRILHAVRETKPEKLVLAHLGGWKEWDAVEELIAGENVWMDTAFLEDYIDDGQFLRIIRKHGVEKILFGTDCPWSGQKESAERLRGLPLTEEEKERIFSGNAAKLLGSGGINNI
ncbi:MAG: amidohydrolase family protein [Lachnospiraceae bacterium]|nr:amidohydrolase family protein [Lachnospiraceae bacterium]